MSATVAKLSRGDHAHGQIVAPDLADLVEHSGLRIASEIGDDIGVEPVPRASHRSTAFSGSSVASKASKN